MGIGFDRAEIVDGDHLDVLAIGFGDGAQDVAADAAKPVDGNAYCHMNHSRLARSAAATMYHDTYIVFRYIFPSSASTAWAMASAEIPEFFYSSLSGSCAP